MAEGSLINRWGGLEGSYPLHYSYNAYTHSIPGLLQRKQIMLYLSQNICASP